MPIADWEGVSIRRPLLIPRAVFQIGNLSGIRGREKSLDTGKVCFIFQITVGVEQTDLFFRKVPLP